jgi:hypothetical protein
MHKMTLAFTIVPNTTRIINPSPDEIARCEKQFLQNKERTTRFRESLANDPEKRSKRIETRKRSKKERPDADVAYERRVKNDSYYRPFISIDAEGQNYPGLDDIKLLHGVVDQHGEPVLPAEITFPAHHTFLWGAKGSRRKHSASEIEAAGADRKRMMLEMSDTAEYWLGENPPDGPRNSRMAYKLTR